MIDTNADYKDPELEISSHFTVWSDQYKIGQTKECMNELQGAYPLEYDVSRHGDGLFRVVVTATEPFMLSADNAKKIDNSIRSYTKNDPAKYIQRFVRGLK